MNKNNIKLVLKKLILILSVLLIIGSFLAGCSTKPLYEPEIGMPSRPSTAKVRSVVVNALKKRGWIIERDWKNSAQARYRRGQHMAVIKVQYDRSQVKIAYVSSQNLKYGVKNGQRIIHRTYNNWAHRLERDIERDLSYAGITSEVRTVPPGSGAREVPRTTRSSRSTDANRSSGSASRGRAGSVTGSGQGAILPGDSASDDKTY